MKETLIIFGTVMVMVGLAPIFIPSLLNFWWMMPVGLSCLTCGIPVVAYGISLTSRKHRKEKGVPHW